MKRRSHRRLRGILVVVDNTFSTSYFQKPLELGADIVVYSATKYYAGHSDILAGLIVLNDEKYYEKLKFISNTLGGIISPFDAFLLHRGIKTLGIRMEQHQKNATALAQLLDEHPIADEVFYPGLPTNSQYRLQNTQSRGNGAVLSFRFNERDYDLNAFVTNAIRAAVE